MSLQDWLVVLGAVSTFITAVAVPSVILIINAVNKNTGEVAKGNEQAAVADVRKIALSETIAQPFVNSNAPGVATVAADPLEARIRRIEEALAGKADTET